MALDKMSLKILKIYSDRQKLNLIELGAILNQSPIDVGQYVLRLQEKSYLRVNPDHAARQQPGQENVISPDTLIEITIDGRELLEDTARADKLRKQDSVRYRITTGISLAAIIIALIALLAQLGLIPLPRL